jgi:dihydrolipoamide dehydrogenase
MAVADADTYDVIVLGAGTTGENLAARAARGGLSAAVVESDLAGGECSYWACMPSKALLRPGQALAAASDVGGSREAVRPPLDVPAVLARRDSFTSHWDDSNQAAWLAGVPVSLVRGHGRLDGARRVTVSLPGGGTRFLSARQAVAVCTGSEPSLPPVAGLVEVKPWTSREGTSVSAPPRRVAILGGGAVGCELAMVYRSLGSGVALVELADRLLATHEPFVSDLVAEALSEQGVDVRTGARVTRAERDGPAGPVTLDLGDGQRLEADKVMVAAGRRPRTADLGLETVGLEPGGWLGVDDSGRVQGVDGGWLYASGDVNGRALLTHQGKYQARAAGAAIVARARGELGDEVAPWTRFASTADHGAVPSVIFTDPEVAAVGLTEAEARRQGLPVRALEYDLASVAGASLIADGYRGRVKLVIDEDRRVLVGATFVGRDVAELLHSATVAVVGEVPLERLWHAVPSYPTISEVWLWMLEDYGL